MASLARTGTAAAAKITAAAALGSTTVGLASDRKEKVTGISPHQALHARCHTVRMCITLLYTPYEPLLTSDSSKYVTACA